MLRALHRLVCPQILVAVVFSDGECVRKYILTFVQDDPFGVSPFFRATLVSIITKVLRSQNALGTTYGTTGRWFEPNPSTT